MFVTYSFCFFWTIDDPIPAAASAKPGGGPFSSRMDCARCWVYIVAVAVGVFFCSRRLQQQTQRTMQSTRMQQPPTAAAMIAMKIVIPIPAIIPATSDVTSVSVVFDGGGDATTGGDGGERVRYHGGGGDGAADGGGGGGAGGSDGAGMIEDGGSLREICLARRRLLLGSANCVASRVVGSSNCARTAR